MAVSYIHWKAKCYCIHNVLTNEQIKIHSHGTNMLLTHGGRVTHICVSKQAIFGSDNGMSSGRRQVVILTSAGILLIVPLGTNSEISIEILTFSFNQMRLRNGGHFVSASMIIILLNTIQQRCMGKLDSHEIIYLKLPTFLTSMHTII